MLELALRTTQLALILGAGTLVWMSISPFARSQTPSEDLPLVAPPAAAPARAEMPRYAIISERNLFTPLVGAPIPEEAPAAPIVETKLKARLLGTAALEDDEEGSLAIVRDVNGKVLTLGIGGELAAGAAKISEIEKRRIVIEHQGRLEALSLDEESAVAAGDTPPSGRSRGVSRQAADDADALRARMQAGMSSSAEMLSFMRAIRQLGRYAAERDTEGNLNGIRITRISQDSPLEDLGVQVGDRITTVNGLSLSGESAGIGLMSSIASGQDLVLQIEDEQGRSRETVVPRSVIDGLVGGR